MYIMVTVYDLIIVVRPFCFVVIDIIYFYRNLPTVFVIFHHIFNLKSL